MRLSRDTIKEYSDIGIERYIDEIFPLKILEECIDIYLVVTEFFEKVVCELWKMFLVPIKRKRKNYGLSRQT